MASTLQIIISARDNASKAIGGIGSNLSQLGKWAAIGGAGMATGLAGATAGLLKLGSDAEEMQAKFNTVFGQFAPQTAASLGTFADQVGRNQFELMGFAATLQDTFVPLGFARQAAAEMSTDLVKLAVDLGSFNNVSEATVVEDLQSALVGNTETLRKYGIVASQARIEQEAINTGLWDGVGAIDASAKAQAIMQIAIASTADAQGDALETSGSFANQMRAVTSSLTEAATAAGVQLLPVFTPLLQSLGQIANEMLPLMVTRFAEFATSLGATIGPAGLLIEDAFTRIGMALGLTSEKVTAVDVIMATFGGVLDAIVIAVQAFALGMQGLATVVEAVSLAVSTAIGLWDQLMTIFAAAGVFDTAQSAIDSLASGISSIGGAITSVIDLWGTMAAAFSSIQIPDILTPGSPTPMELGLRGIASALKDISKAPPPGFGAAGAGGSAGGGTMAINLNLDGRQIASVLAPNDATRKMGGMTAL